MRGRLEGPGTELRADVWQWRHRLFSHRWGPADLRGRNPVASGAFNWDLLAPLCHISTTALTPDVRHLKTVASQDLVQLT